MVRSLLLLLCYNFILCMRIDPSKLTYSYISQDVHRFSKASCINVRCWIILLLTVNLEDHWTEQQLAYCPQTVGAITDPLSCMFIWPNNWGSLPAAVSQTASVRLQYDNGTVVCQDRVDMCWCLKVQ